ncbi:MAG: RNase adapter RapZ [Eubacterium sp.]|nr:RNase adapter RapZ [Eubacterium sp.]NBI86438.1 RNase adapter RapZ [Lachnospiraceae bacterium]
MKLVILTGMSGAGKSTALKMMEDIGFYCVDNLPIPLIEKFVELSESSQDELQKFAIGVDIRSGNSLSELHAVLNRLTEGGKLPEILFLDAEDAVLVKRYKETRRSHPLSGGERVGVGLQKERSRLHFLRQRADYIIDTSRMLTRELWAELDKIFVKQQDYKNLFITILSFGFKYGIPADSDLVFDVRFLPNPFYVEGLRQKSGNDKEIQDYVLQFKEAHMFLIKLADMVNFLIPNYIIEGKNQLVISIGCTGGKHRSVTLANELYKQLANCKEYGLKIEHRDIEKDVLRN